MNLQLASRSDSVFSTSLGARFYTSIIKYQYVNSLLEWADGLWTPEVNVRWRRLWTGNSRQLDALMPDAPSEVPAYRVDARDAKSGVEFGANLRFQPLDWRASLALEYEGFYGDGSLIHQFGISARVPF